MAELQHTAPQHHEFVIGVPRSFTVERHNFATIAAHSAGWQRLTLTELTSPLA